MPLFFTVDSTLFCAVWSVDTGLTQACFRKVQDFKAQFGLWFLSFCIAPRWPENVLENQDIWQAAMQ